MISQIVADDFSRNALAFLELVDVVGVMCFPCELDDECIVFFVGFFHRSFFVHVENNVDHLVSFSVLYLVAYFGFPVLTRFVVLNELYGFIELVEIRFFKCNASDVK